MENHQEERKANENNDENELSDLIPSSLESDYEEIKLQHRKDEITKGYNFTFSMLTSDVRDAYGKNSFNLETLKKIDSLHSRVTCRFSGSDVLSFSLNNLERA